MKISIIIPVYNAEKYLSKCLDSILASIAKIPGEILLIDNSSKDNSLQIMQAYHQKHPKLIRILTCSDWGAAAVRNYGVQKARGEYLWFIDADDYIDKTAIPKLLKVADDTNADLIMIGAKREGKKYLSAIDMKDPNYKSRFVRYGMGPWQVLIRRKWWLKHHFTFKPGQIHEDMELMSSLILYTDHFASINEPLYFYRQTPDSVLHQPSFNKHVYDIFPALTGLYKRFQDANAIEEYHDELEWFFIWNLLIDSAKDFSQFKEAKPGFALSRQMLREYFPNWRHNKFLREKPLKLQLRIRLNYLR